MLMKGGVMKSNVLCCARRAVTHRFDVTMQEADRVDALDGLQDLAPQSQGGADAEGSPGHTPPQVGQITTLTEHIVQDQLTN